MNNPVPGSEQSLPRSTSSFGVNLATVSFFFIAIFSLHHQIPTMPAYQLLIAGLLATVIPLWFYELIVLKVHQRPSTGLIARPSAPDRPRVVIKLIGLFGTFLIILILYTVIPFYRGPFYSSFFDFLHAWVWVIAALSVIYFWEIDRRQADPYDGYWHMGCLLTGSLTKVNAVILREHAAVWFIKAFFTPIMFGILESNINRMLLFNWREVPQSFALTHDFLLTLFYMIDVIFGTLGYIFTCRLLDTHIRSTEPTFLGWYVCLACYFPFSKWGTDIFRYETEFSWMEWLALSPLEYYVFGIIIIILIMIYGLATVAFGYRMSNLTYRGIITSGPYRFTKHPAYLCKVISWWMIYVPFYSIHGALAAWQNCLALAAITLIYYLRARTEENHLSNYPEYVQYAEWIKRHGLFSFITKYLPSFQYSVEKCRRWKSIVWFKKIK